MTLSDWTNLAAIRAAAASRERAGSARREAAMPEMPFMCGSPNTEVAPSSKGVVILPWVCPALIDGRCAAYEVRPMICRAWGATEEMPCPHGCRPADGPLLTGPKTRALVEASQRPEVEQ